MQSFLFLFIFFVCFARVLLRSAWRKVNSANVHFVLECVFCLHGDSLLSVMNSCSAEDLYLERDDNVSARNFDGCTRVDIIDPFLTFWKKKASKNTNPT